MLDNDILKEKGKRHDRLEEAYLRELISIMNLKINDPRLSGVIVTDVLFTPDLKTAKVYFNMPDEHTDIKKVLNGFYKSKGFIKKEINQQINIKYTPDLKFYFDDRENVQTSIDELFDQIASKA
ncbi:ribosome-binding factor A [bacterium K02(2017)]|nr:ribosome-binding factor A [bacterium K02(2017)]